MKKETFLCPGGGFEQVDAVLVARSKGYRVIVADPRPKPPVTRFCDVSVRAIDLSDVDSLVSLCRKEEIAAILPVPLGKSLLGISRVVEAMDFNGPSPDSTELCVDKLKFSQLMSKLSIPHPVTSLLEDWNDRGDGEFVVKPRFGSGGRGVRLCVNSSLASAEKGDPFLAQSRLRGREYGIDGLFFPGGVRLLQIRKKHSAGDEPDQLPVLSLYQSIASAEFSSVLQKFLERIQERLTFRKTPFHADVIVSEDGLVSIVELSPRPSGLGLSGPLMRLSQNTDSVSEFLSDSSETGSSGALIDSDCFCWAGQPSGNVFRVLESMSPAVEIRQLTEADKQKEAAYSYFFRCDSSSSNPITLLTEI